MTGSLSTDTSLNCSGTTQVQMFYTAQTPDQIRGAQELGPDNPPARVPLYLPECEHYYTGGQTARPSGPGTSAQVSGGEVRGGL